MADPAIRFLGFFKQPDSVSVSNPYELDESDVIWSPDVDESLTIDSSDAIELNDSDSPILSTSESTLSNSSSQGNSNHSFRYLGLGLSAALTDHDRSLVQRKSSMKTIPPVSNPRSVTGSDDFSGSYTGRFHQSAPVNVPIWPKVNSNNNNNFNGSAKLGFFEEEDEEVEEEMLPPHEIVAKSHSTTFSVFEGVGRTLKGRDLRRVRNAVFQKTVAVVRKVKFNHPKLAQISSLDEDTKREEEKKRKKGKAKELRIGRQFFVGIPTKRKRCQHQWRC